jgi:hypothetical protein
LPADGSYSFQCRFGHVLLAQEGELTEKILTADAGFAGCVLSRVLGRPAYSLTLAIHVTINHGEVMVRVCPFKRNYTAGLGAVGGDSYLV